MSNKIIVLITFVTVFAVFFSFIFFYGEFYLMERLIIGCGGISLIVSFIVWGTLSMADSSMKVWKKIEALEISAKKAKTKEELNTVIETYRTVRRNCQHNLHYAEMNKIYAIIETKQEFIK